MISIERKDLLKLASVALLLAVAFVAVAARPVYAATVAYEGFEYGSGSELDTQSGGTGWTGSWTAATAVTGIASTSFGSGDHLLLDGDGNNYNEAAVRQLGTTLGDDEDGFYASMLFQYEGGTIDNNDFAFVWFNNAATFSNLGFGLKGNQATSTASNPDLMARTALTTEVYQENLNDDGSPTPYWLVIHVYKSVSGAANPFDRVDFWVNPAFGDSGTPEGTSSGTSGLTSLSYVGVRLANFDADDNVRLDNLTLASTWADLFPDLTATKSNDVSGSVAYGSSFTWSVRVQNVGTSAAAFTAGQRVLNDGLPTTDMTYGAVTVTGESGITGSPTCFISGSNDAVLCNANGATGTTIGVGGEFTVNVVMNPTAPGTFTNPTGGFCRVDPQNLIGETNDEVTGTNNNDCGPDVVDVVIPDLAASKTASRANVPAGFPFSFDFVLSNVGNADGTFSAGEVFFHDDLNTAYAQYPDAAITPTVTDGVSTTGTGYTCTVASAVVECVVDAGSTVTFLTTGTLEFSVDGKANGDGEGDMDNPAPGGICQINPVVPGGPVTEANYANNDCYAAVDVYAHGPYPDGPEYSITGSGTANGNIITWGWEVCNLMDSASPGLNVRFDVGSDQAFNSSVPAGTVEGQTLWVPLNPLQGGECAQISIETTYTGGTAALSSGMRARAVDQPEKAASRAALQGTLVCMDGSVADVGARACAAVGAGAAEFPTTLPATGGQPVAGIPVWAVVVLAGLLAIGATTGYIVKRRSV